MFDPSDEERYWFVRNLALGLVEYMGADHPPILIERLIKHPPAIYPSMLSLVECFRDFWEPMNRLPLCVSEGAKIVVPLDLPLKERRFALAREVLMVIGGSEHGQAMDLAGFLLPDLWEMQNYFARVLLAPDQMLVAYLKQGKGLEDFSDTFLLPPRTAATRLGDPILL